MRPPEAEQRDRPRRRLDGAARRSELLDAARRLIVEQGYLPLSMEALGRAAGVSKALVYAHFPDQHDLYNAVVEAALDDLDRRGSIARPSPGDDLPSAACAAAETYLAHVSSCGTVLHIVYRDLYMSGRLTARARRERDRVLGGFARAARRTYGCPAREAVAATNLILTLPEEVGRLVFQGDLAAARGAALCRELVLGALTALAETARR